MKHLILLLILFTVIKTSCIHTHNQTNPIINNNAFLLEILKDNLCSGITKDEFFFLAETNNNSNEEDVNRACYNICSNDQSNNNMEINGIDACIEDLNNQQDNSSAIPDINTSENIVTLRTKYKITTDIALVKNLVDLFKIIVFLRMRLLCIIDSRYI